MKVVLLIIVIQLIFAPVFAETDSIISFDICDYNNTCSNDSNFLADNWVIYNSAQSCESLGCYNITCYKQDSWQCSSDVLNVYTTIGSFNFVCNNTLCSTYTGIQTNNDYIEKFIIFMCVNLIIFIIFIIIRSCCINKMQHFFLSIMSMVTALVVYIHFTRLVIKFIASIENNYRGTHYDPYSLGWFITCLFLFSVYILLEYLLVKLLLERLYKKKAVVADDNV